jgi:GNAT superfamily N-acetyltransferase
MVPLGTKATDWLIASDDAPHRSIALSHASTQDLPGLWADDPEHPTCIVWLREGDEGRWEAFAAGFPRPALDWLAHRAEGRPIALLAPPFWERSVRAMGGRVEVGTIQTWLGLEYWNPSSSSGDVRRLAMTDQAAFEAVAPSWSLRSWGDFPTLIERGVAFGIPAKGGFSSGFRRFQAPSPLVGEGWGEGVIDDVNSTPVSPIGTSQLLRFETPGRAAAPSPTRGEGAGYSLRSREECGDRPATGGFAALAWTYELNLTHAKIGVVTVPRFRKLGLGRSAASALLDWIVFDRRTAPVWVTSLANPASIALARSLGFSRAIEETLLNWTPDRR